MQALDHMQIEAFRNMLEEQMSELVSRAKETLSALTENGEIEADPLDRAVSDNTRESNLRIREREGRLIQKIKSTLVKIEAGTFGICESCGEDIPLPRLKARPVTAHCIQCKTQMENWEKATGQ